MAGWLKVTGALLLVACFALPMKSCTQYLDETGKRVPVASGEAPATGVRPVTTRYYLLEELRADDPWSWLRVAVFICPAAVVAYTRRRPAARLAQVLWFIEPLILAGVAFSLWYITFIFSRPDVGYYVAVGGLAIYFLGWVNEAWRKWRARGRQRPTSRSTTDAAR
jgi:hypothetical protein